MWKRVLVVGCGPVLLVVLCSMWILRPSSAQSPTVPPRDRAVIENARQLLDEGRRVFRYETFGDEAYWGETLELHRAIAGAKLGGVGPGVSPKTALSVGLKVDSDAIPAPVAAALKAEKVDLDDPASTMVLLKANAVVGVTGHFDGSGRLTSMGVQCAFCHSPSRVLGVDEAAVKKVLASWGPGKFDALLNLDGKAFRPDGKSAATLIPPAFGLAGVNLHTWGGAGGRSRIGMRSSPISN